MVGTTVGRCTCVGDGAGAFVGDGAAVAVGVGCGEGEGVTPTVGVAAGVGVAPGVGVPASIAVEEATGVGVDAYARNCDAISTKQAQNKSVPTTAIVLKFFFILLFINTNTHIPTFFISPGDRN